MITLHIQHHVTDFTAWKGYFDKFSDFRERGGVRGHRVFRATDDPTYVMIELDFDNIGAAEALQTALQRDVWKSPESAPALVGKPQTRIVEVMESKAY